MAPQSRSTYKESIHILFKVKNTKTYVIATAGIISFPKLPSDNISLLEVIEKCLSDQSDTKIRIEEFNGQKSSKKIVVTTISGFSKLPSGRAEMEALKDRLYNESKLVEEAAKKMAEEEAKKKAEIAKKKMKEDTKKKAEEATRKAEEKSKKIAEEELKKKAEEAERKAEEESKKKAEEPAKRKSADLESNSHKEGPAAKKRLVFSEESSSSKQNINESQDDMFHVSSSDDEDEADETEENEEEDGGEEEEEEDDEEEEQEDEDEEEEENVNEEDQNGQNIDRESLFDVATQHTQRLMVLQPVPISTSTQLADCSPPEDSSLPADSSPPSVSEITHVSAPTNRQQKFSDLNDRVVQLEAENDYLHHQIDKKDLEISSLKKELVELKNQKPEGIIEKLNAALALVDGLNSRNGVDAASAASRNTQRHSTSGENVMVQLVQGHTLRIEKSDLKFAITIGRLSKNHLHQMVNKLMESIYTRIYMSQHSLSGSSPRISRAQKEMHVRLNTPPTKTKPGLPKEDVVAITLFMINAWQTYHKEVVTPKQIKDAIRSKLSTETRAYLQYTPPTTPTEDATSSA